MLLRKASKDTDITILVSYRAIDVIADMKDDDLFTLAEVVEMAVVKGLPADDLEMVSPSYGHRKNE